MKKFTLLSGLLFSFMLLKAQTNTLPDISLVPFSSGFSQPVGVEHAGDSRLFVVEQTGKIRIVDANGNHKSHFLNLSDKISTAGFEQGLLGLTFDPDYANNGYFYVHYTNLEGNSTISRFRVNPNNPGKALPSSELIMWTNDDPFRNHNSGQLAFGPDGYLYFTMGDGGSGGDPFNNGQDLSTTFGKLLRIDPTNTGYAIPSSNPYAGMDGFAGEIWASGLRNPWRFSFDALTGDLWIPDVGQNTYEEVNFTSAASSGGENYGWSCREATHFFEADCDDNGIPFTDPVAEYAHAPEGEFPCSGSITGGYVYRGDEYPDMYGKYFYTDFCTGVIRTTYMYEGEWITAELGNFTPFAYSTFGQDINNEMYLIDKTSGIIYRFTDGGGGGAFTILVGEPVPEFQIQSVSRLANDEIDLDETIRETIHQATFTPPLIAGLNDNLLTPNPNNGQFTVSINSQADSQYTLRVTDAMGHEIMSAKKEAIKGFNQWEMNSTGLSTGVYFLQIRNPDQISTIRFMVE